MSQRRVSAGRKRQVAGSDFMEVTSEVEQPVLAPGGVSKHDLRFKFLTTLELELRFTVQCPNDAALGYPTGKKWNGDPWRGKGTVGGLDTDLRIAEFSKDMQVNPDFTETGNSKNQRLSLRAEARCGSGEWDASITLDHPIVVIG